MGEIDAVQQGKCALEAVCPLQGDILPYDGPPENVVAVIPCHENFGTCEIGIEVRRITCLVLIPHAGNVQGGFATVCNGAVVALQIGFHEIVHSFMQPDGDLAVQ